MAGQARQATLPGREIVVGREAFIPFVAGRARPYLFLFLSTYVPPLLPISNRPQKGPRRQARTSTKTAAPPEATPPPTRRSPPQTPHPPAEERPATRVERAVQSV